MDKAKQAKKWVRDRLIYVTENCDLKIEENKIAYDSLKTVLDLLEKGEKEDEC